MRNFKLIKTSRRQKQNKVNNTKMQKIFSKKWL